MHDANLSAENQAGEAPSASPHCSLTKEEWADYIRSDLAAGAARIPLSRAARGRFSGDVSALVFGRDLRGEVKCRGNRFNRLYDWLEDRDLLFIRADRNPLLVVVELELAAEIAARAKGSAP